jgi:hypothetical protein
MQREEKERIQESLVEQINISLPASYLPKCKPLLSNYTIFFSLLTIVANVYAQDITCNVSDTESGLPLVGKHCR